MSENPEDLENKDCDDCNFTVGVKMTESLCNFLGKDDKDKCEEIIEEIEKGKQTFSEGLDKIEDKFKRSLEFIDVMRKLGKEKGILNGRAKPE